MGENTYYVDFSADRLMAATGYYQMAKDQLERYRSTLSTDRAALTRGAELRAAINQLAEQGLVVEGEALKIFPRGIARDVPNIDLLRRKSLTISSTLPSQDLANAATVIGHVRALWKAGECLNAWLFARVGPSRL